ncbi:MAG: T9SS type A sorting domain-containing protein [Limnohabitans sp.]|nr:T9SS type A sorting domain-containing protein [Limnohabitans sp.]
MKNNKLHFIFLLLLLSVVNGYSRVIYVVNPGNGNDIWQNLVNAIISANYTGDEIVLPSGTFTFSSSIWTSKRFVLRGQQAVAWPGNPTTILMRSETMDDALLESAAMINFTTDVRESSGLVIKDIEFRSKIPSIYEGDGKSKATDYALTISKAVDFTITRCVFKYFGYAAVQVTHWDNQANGLIFNCKFDRNAKGWDGQGLGYGVYVRGEDKVWQSSEQWGTSNFVFVENCTFNYHRHSLATSGCGKVVFRYNTDTNNDISVSSVNHSVDSHSARGTGVGTGNNFSTFAIEAYNNSITHNYFWSNNGTQSPIVSGQDPARLLKYGLICRGGGALYYNNTVIGTRFAVGLYVDNFPFGSTYPIKYAPGYGTSRLYIWNNNFTPYVSGNDWAGLPNSGLLQNINNGIYNNNGVYDASKEYFKLNRDYFFTAKSGYTAYTYPHPRRSNPLAARVAESNTVYSEFVDGKNERIFTFYPNPVQDVLKVEISKNDLPAQVEIINKSGEVVLKSEISEENSTLNIANLNKGLYVIKAQTQNEIYTKKLVKN